MSSLDDELDRQVQSILTRGEEGRRDAAVRELTAASSRPVAVRVAVAAAAVAAAVALMYATGLGLVLQAGRSLCVAVGLCG